jgi:hypothetical protein
MTTALLAIAHRCLEIRLRTPARWRIVDSRVNQLRIPTVMGRSEQFLRSTSHLPMSRLLSAPTISSRPFVHPVSPRLQSISSLPTSISKSFSCLLRRLLLIGLFTGGVSAAWCLASRECASLTPPRESSRCSASSSPTTRVLQFESRRSMRQPQLLLMRSPTERLVSLAG